MVAASNSNVKPSRPGRKSSSFRCQSCAVPIAPDTVYHGMGEKGDRSYTHADGRDCKEQVAKIQENASLQCALCHNVPATLYDTSGGKDDDTLYRCDECFFTQRAALLDEFASFSLGNLPHRDDNTPKKKPRPNEGEYDANPSSPSA